jgi:hypothetical protein
MEVIIGALLGFFIGILCMGLMASRRVSDLIWERNYYKKALVDEKIKVNQRDVLIRDIIKEPATTTNQN